MISLLYYWRLLLQYYFSCGHDQFHPTAFRTHLPHSSRLTPPIAPIAPNRLSLTCLLFYFMASFLQEMNFSVKESMHHYSTI